MVTMNHLFLLPVLCLNFKTEDRKDKKERNHALSCH